MTGSGVLQIADGNVPPMKMSVYSLADANYLFLNLDPWYPLEVYAINTIEMKVVRVLNLSQAIEFYGELK